MSKATFNVGIGLDIKCTVFYFQTLMNARPIRFKMELSLSSHTIDMKVMKIIVNQRSSSL